MNQGTYPLAAAMVNQLNRVDNIANNLANANTNGFKQEGLSEGSFNQYLQRAQEARQAPTKQEEVFNKVPKIDNKFINGDVGAIVPTGNSLDFAISEPNAFFKVQDNNGNMLLTRDGSFKVLNGELVTQNGYKVLSADNDVILAEDGFAGNIGIERTDYKNLEKIGNNNYRVLDEGNLTALPDNEGIVSQGALEKSNVNSVESMVALIDAHRRFEQAQKAVLGIDETNSKLIDKVGSVR
jgi:flagellar basal-body rod protein FlgF